MEQIAVNPVGFPGAVGRSWDQIWGAWIKRVSITPVWREAVGAEKQKLLETDCLADGW